jgi:SAM-dependent methyltransferase
VPSNVDVERPNSARLIDYYLGGAHNFAVDRELGDRSNEVVPGAQITRDTRFFLRRAVRMCVQSGIRQFLDLGSGIPTAGNVHEVAHAVDPTCRTVYVDNDPVAVAHARAMLKGDPQAAIAFADIRDPQAVLGAEETTRLLDLSQPLAVLMIGVLHYLTDADDPDRVVAAYRDAAAPGSLFVLSHLTCDSAPELTSKLVELSHGIAMPLVPRPLSRFTDLLTGLDLLEPGITHTPHWRGEAERTATNGAATVSYAAVGRKP